MAGGALTRITRMQMKGFKSFANATEIVFGERFNCVLGPNGSGKSAAPDTEVLLADGSVVRIGELVEEQLAKTRSKIPLDDGVYCPNPDGVGVVTLNPTTMKAETLPVLAFARREGEETLYDIRTKAGKSVTMTACHPLMVYRGGEIVSTRVENLCVGERIAAPRKLSLGMSASPLPQPEEVQSRCVRDKKVEFPQVAGPLLGRWLGLLIGDGYLTDARVEFVNAQKSLIDQWIALSEEVFCLKDPYVEQKGNHYRIIYHTRKVPAFIGSLIEEKIAGSLTSARKRIPQSLLRADDATVAALLAGLLDTDGYIGKSQPSAEFTTKSPVLARQVQGLLLRFGILSRITVGEKCATNTQAKTKRPYARLFIEGAENIGKLSVLGLHHEEKAERIERWKSKTRAGNPNTDLLPREANELVKSLVKELRIPIKKERKAHPRIAAYVENRCSPSREGILAFLGLARKYWDENASILRSVRGQQENLVRSLKSARLPITHASGEVEVGKNTLLLWNRGKHRAREQHLVQLHRYVLEEISDRMVRAEFAMRTLEALATSDIVWEEIASIEEVQGTPYVYDLCVAGNHNFVANHLFVHNSNILDSLVFVLGKSGAKSMRAEKTANLIYNGGKLKNPAKEAIVSIYFDNESKIFGEGFDELKISRVVKSSGQSDYLVNDEKKTRSEVVEMLEKARIDPDGHNIILQGDIVRLIEMAGIERRQLVEEVAGIGVYEEKKEKALRELQRVDEKLTETQIILTEREAYLKELKSERDQALKFKDLQDKLKRNKKTVLEKKVRAREKEKEKYESAIGKNREAIDEATAQIEEIKEKIAREKKEIDKVNAEIEEKGEKEQVQLHKEVEELRVRIGVSAQRQESLRQELKKVGERREQLVKTNQDLFDKIKYIEEEKETLKKDLSEHEKSLEQIDARIAEFKKKHSVEDAGRLDKEMAGIDEEAERLQEQLSELRGKQQEAMREKDRIDIRIEQSDERIAKVLDAEKANKQQLDDLKHKQHSFKQASKELAQALQEDAELASQLQNARQKVGKLTEELTKLQAQNTSIQEGAGGNLAIAKIMEQKLKGVVGTVAQLGSVKQEHQLALEIAAGGRINSIVVEDDKTAGSCIDYLRKNKVGVANFLPMNKLKDIHEDKSLAKKPGAIGMATSLVEYDARYDKVFRYVFGNTLVVENLDAARKIGIGAARMVTLQGDLAETSGAMQGGFRSQHRRGLGFQQKELSERIARLERELADNESVAARVESKRRENEQAIERLRQHKAELEGEIIKLEKSLHLESQDLDMNKEEKKRLQEEAKRIERELDDATAKIGKANRELAQLKIAKQKLREQISSMRSPEVLAQLTSFEEKQQSIKERISEIASQLKANDAQLTSVLGPEAKRIKEILKQHDKEEDEFKAEQKEIASLLGRLEKELSEKEAREREFLAQFKGLFQQRDKAASAIVKLEKEEDGHALKIRELETKNTGAGMELARVKAELAGLSEEGEQYTGVESFEGKSEEDCLVEIRQFERMLSEIGAVNMKALEVYDSVEREYTELVQKKERLGLEREDVLVMINEIDSKKKEIFLRTFDVLNENFQRIFKTLSVKGEAYLEIESPKEVFDGGVAIKVRLSGKKFMDIRSLSGGEKTMTALAFLFAIQEHEPAHFYILDEVDAALDKHNSEKLANLVRAYCKGAQYIVISHNDAVISEADNLYGISMNDHGISKITSLEI